MPAQYLFPNGHEHTRWDSQSFAFFNPVPPIFLELRNRLLICSLLEICTTGTSSIFLLSIILHRAGSAASNTSVIPEAEGEAEGDPSFLIAIPLSSFRNILVKVTQSISWYKERVTLTIPINRIECVGKDKLLVGRTLPDCFCSAAVTFQSAG